MKLLIYKLKEGIKMTDRCEHKYIHFDTKKRKEDRVFGMPEWTRVDIFFCEKCLEEQSKYKYECQWERPEWY